MSLLMFNKEVVLMGYVRVETSVEVIVHMNVFSDTALSSTLEDKSKGS